jgi:6-pyruvoyltetrahydropterin/6-carboxytetrahydropterin synthase
MTESFHVRIDKAEHVFSAAHFITIGGQCERLHGHNYHVAAEFCGALDGNFLVIDFLLVRAKLRAIVTSLDHYVLLPTRHPHLRVEDDGHDVVVTHGKSRWLFPRGDCQLLPVANTTAEQLAAHIGQRVLAELGAEAGKLTRVRIEVDECEGQIAVWERDI